MDFRDFIFYDTGTLTLEPLSGSELLTRHVFLRIRRRLPPPNSNSLMTRGTDSAVLLCRKKLPEHRTPVIISGMLVKFKNFE